MKLRNKSGITLIALIVTIIVLIIIAGISIATLTADNGILRQTNAAKISQLEGTAREQVKLACSAMRLAVAEAQAKDNSYSAKANASLIQAKLIEVLNADKKDLIGNFSNGGILATDGTEKFKIVYEGDDYKNACNDTSAKITYTIGLGQRSVELLKEQTSNLKDEEGNQVNTGIGELPDNTAGLYETGSDYTVQLKTWQELLDEGIVHVENGVVYTQTIASPTDVYDPLSGDLMLPNDGSITSIGDVVWDLVNDTVKSGQYVGFTDCENLTGIVIPDSVEFISSIAFAGCNLTEVTIPASVNRIEVAAFVGCSNLQTVIIESCGTTIGQFAFEQCPLTNGITQPEHQFDENYTCTKCGFIYGAPGLYETGSDYTVLLKTWDELVSAGVLYVEDGAVYVSTTAVTNTRLFIPNPNAGLLAGDLIIPNDGTITKIGIDAFASCNQLTGLKIPLSVVNIGSGAFRNCNALNTITYKGTMEQWETGITFEEHWNLVSYINKIICSDGELNLNN